VHTCPTQDPRSGARLVDAVPLVHAHPTHADRSGAFLDRLFVLYRRKVDREWVSPQPRL